MNVPTITEQIRQDVQNARTALETAKLSAAAARIGRKKIILRFSIYVTFR